MPRRCPSAPPRPPAHVPPPCAQCVVAAQCPVTLRRQQAGPDSAAMAPQARLWRRGQVLQRQGEAGARTAFVKLGLMAIRRLDASGRERAIAVIGPATLLGQSSTFERATMFTVQALTPVATCEFSPRLVQDLVQLPVSASDFVLQHTRQVIATLADWSLLLRLPRLEHRLTLALQLLARMQPAGAVRVPNQTVLAELLGAQRESINRVWKDLELRGVVRRRSGGSVDINHALLLPPPPPLPR